MVRIPGIPRWRQLHNPSLLKNWNWRPWRVMVRICETYSTVQKVANLHRLGLWSKVASPLKTSYMYRRLFASASPIPSTGSRKQSDSRHLKTSLVDSCFKRERGARLSQDKSSFDKFVNHHCHPPPRDFRSDTTFTDFSWFKTRHLLFVLLGVSGEP